MIKTRELSSHTFDSKNCFLVIFRGKGIVFHELISDQVHIDLHWVKPTAERPFHTLVTSGMSNLPMTTPPGAEEVRYAELSICLPADWKLSEEDFKEYFFVLKLYFFF